MAGSGTGTPSITVYPPVGLVNVALLRIGANTITSSTDGSPNALKAAAIWEYIRDEVLSARDWRFAKIRYKMVRNLTAPLYAYTYAYTLPTDFLRLVKPKWTGTKGLNPVVSSSRYLSDLTYVAGSTHFIDYDPPVYPSGLPYIIESLPDGTKVLETDYDNTSDDLFITYIKKETDYTRYTPTFNNLLIYRMAMELALAITESLQKFQLMKGLYDQTLISTEAVNESYDYLADEVGSDSWERAGR